MRLFVAANLPGKIRSLLDGVQQNLKVNLPRLRWVRSDRIHLTLRFIGEVEEEGAARLKAFLRSLLIGFEGGVPLRLSGLGVFPERGRPQVLWAGLVDDASSPGGLDRLDDLHTRIEQGVVAAGCPPESRDFHPHLTLARLPSGSRVRGIFEAMEGARFEPAAFEIERVGLIRSFPGPGGARYETLEEYAI